MVRTPDYSIFKVILKGAILIKEFFFQSFGFLPSELTFTLWTITKIMAICVPVMASVAYITFAERKIIGYIQARVGPNRVGPKGWLQPIADALKLLTKEVVIPNGANKLLFLAAPVLALAPSLAAWAAVPFDSHLVLADINAGLLYVLALTSLGVYGIIIAGWASNSKYAFLGAMRSAAQIVSYEIAMGFCIGGCSHSGRKFEFGRNCIQSGQQLGFSWLVLGSTVSIVCDLLYFGSCRN